MSPEQLDGQPLTPQSDIFSLGAILAYAGTGHLPFGGSTIPAIAAQILTHQPNLDSLTGVAGLAAGLGVLVFNKHPATIHRRPDGSQRPSPGPPVSPHRRGVRTGRHSR